MKKEYRVKKNQEIENILKNRKYSANSYFSVYKMTNPKTSHFRYAISVGKKIGKAVERNYLKRRITAILNQINIPIEQNIDINNINLKRMCELISAVIIGIAISICCKIYLI